MHYSIINKLFYLSSLFFKLTDLYTSSFWPIPKREEVLNSLAFSCIYVSPKHDSFKLQGCVLLSTVWPKTCRLATAIFHDIRYLTAGRRLDCWSSHLCIHCTHIVILTAFISDVWRLCYLKPSSLFRRWYNGLGWFQMFVTYVTHFSTSKASIFETIDLATEP